MHIYKPAGGREETTNFKKTPLSLLFYFYLNFCPTRLQLIDTIDLHIDTPELFIGSYIWSY